MKEEPAFEGLGFREEVFGHATVWVILPFAMPNFVHMIPKKTFIGRGVLCFRLGPTLLLSFLHIMLSSLLLSLIYD